MVSESYQRVQCQWKNKETCCSRINAHTHLRTSQRAQTQPYSRRSKSRPAQPGAGPDTDAPEGPPAPPRPGWPPGAPRRPKWPAAAPRRPVGAGGQPFLRSEPFFSGRRAESRRRRGRRPASRRPSGAGGRVKTLAGRGDRWAAVGGPGSGAAVRPPTGACRPRFGPPKIALFEALEIPPSAGRFMGK